jgi:hypothetical protein
VSRRAGYRYGNHGLVPLARVADRLGLSERTVAAVWRSGLRKFARAFHISLKRDEDKLLKFAGFMRERR